MKKPIRVSNLTLDLYLDYVRPAAIAAGIIELNATEDGNQIYVTDTDTADEIMHCMWCACMCAGNDGIERTHEGYIRHEAERMIGQLEVSIKFDLHNTAATLTALMDAMTAALKPAEAPQEAPAAEAEQQPTETAEAAQAAPAARQADDITAAMVDAIGADAPAQTVTVTWANGTRATYSAAMLDLLRTDPAALDIQDDATGEIIYIKPDTTEQEEEETTMTNETPITITLTRGELCILADACTSCQVRELDSGKDGRVWYRLHDVIMAEIIAADAAEDAAQPDTSDEEQKEEGNTMSNTPFTPAEAAMHAATARGIIRRKGGYRERDIINHPHTVERGTWTTEHKVVEILSTTPDPDGYRARCAVDIVTRSIVG